MKRVLVTGATGFVGRHLCPALERAGFTVRWALHTGPAANARPGEWVVVGDINAKTDWTGALKDVDYVIHLAGLAQRVGLSDAELAPLFHRVNYEATKRLAESIEKSPSVKRLIFVSSAKAVASFCDENITTRTECKPSCAYGRSKLLAERSIAKTLDSGSTDYCILRPCLVYGPGNVANIARLMQLIDTGLPLPFGSIRNKKTFVYIGNLIGVVLRAIDHQAASRATFLVSDGEVISTPELIRHIGAYARRQPRLVPFPVWLLRAFAMVGDGIQKLTGRSIGWDSYSVDRLCGSLAVDATETFQCLQWHPPFPVKEAIRLTVAGPNGNSTFSGR